MLRVVLSALFTFLVVVGRGDAQDFSKSEVKEAVILQLIDEFHGKPGRMEGIEIETDNLAISVRGKADWDRAIGRALDGGEELKKGPCVVLIDPTPAIERKCE